MDPHALGVARRRAAIRGAFVVVSVVLALGLILGAWFDPGVGVLALIITAPMFVSALYLLQSWFDIRAPIETSGVARVGRALAPFAVCAIVVAVGGNPIAAGISVFVTGAALRALDVLRSPARPIPPSRPPRRSALEIGPAALSVTTVPNEAAIVDRQPVPASVARKPRLRWKHALAAPIVAWMVGCFVSFGVAAVATLVGVPSWMPLPLSDVGDFAVSPSGTIYVVSKMHNRVLEFDAEGRFERTHRGVGRGTRVDVDDLGRLLVHDGLRRPRTEVQLSDGSIVTSSSNSLARCRDGACSTYAASWLPLRPFAFPLPAGLAWPAFFVLLLVFRRERAEWERRQRRAELRERMVERFLDFARQHDVGGLTVLRAGHDDEVLSVLRNRDGAVVLSTGWLQLSRHGRRFVLDQIEDCRLEDGEQIAFEYDGRTVVTPLAGYGARVLIELILLYQRKRWY